MIKECKAAYVALPVEIPSNLPELLSGQSMINPAFFSYAFGACAGPLPAFLIAALVLKLWTDTYRFMPRLGFVLSILGAIVFGGAFALFWLVYTVILWGWT